MLEYPRNEYLWHRDSAIIAVVIMVIWILGADDTIIFYLTLANFIVHKMGKHKFSQ